MLFLSISFYVNAQKNYFVKEVISSSTNGIIINLTINCTNKKAVKQEACIAALKAILFDGISNTIFNKPLLPDGELTSYQQNQSYFDNLYNYRYSDFINSCIMLSKFKKAENKSTLFQIDVKVLTLRKDLERNNIKRKIGF